MGIPIRAAASAFAVTILRTLPLVGAGVFGGNALICVCHSRRATYRRVGNEALRRRRMSLRWW
jgi:hypothetical protein